jgi:hypothetical protein
VVVLIEISTFECGGGFLGAHSVGLGLGASDVVCFAVDM